MEEITKDIQLKELTVSEFRSPDFSYYIPQTLIKLDLNISDFAIHYDISFPLTLVWLKIKIRGGIHVSLFERMRELQRLKYLCIQGNFQTLKLGDAIGGLDTLEELEYDLVSSYELDRSVIPINVKKLVLGNTMGGKIKLHNAHLKEVRVLNKKYMHTFDCAIDVLYVYAGYDQLIPKTVKKVVFWH